MTQIAIGSRVITRKFEDTTTIQWLNDQTPFIGKEGEITGISAFDNYEVHGYFWPPSAVELVSEAFQPEYGKEIEFYREGDNPAWVRGEIIHEHNGMYWIKEHKITVPIHHFITGSFIRPIRKGLEEKVEEHLKKYGHVLATDTIKQLIDIIICHGKEETPTQLASPQINLEEVEKLVQLVSENASTWPSKEKIVNTWRKLIGYSTSDLPKKDSTASAPKAQNED